MFEIQPIGTYPTLAARILKPMKRTLALVLLVLVALFFAWTYWRGQSSALYGTALKPEKILVLPTLDGSDGKPHTLTDWRGKTLLVFFAYTHCPDVCPLTLSSLARSYEKIGNPKNLQVIMITVDPKRDTPAQLKRYMTAFNPSFIGLTGSPQAISQAAAQFYVGFGNAAAGQKFHTDTVAVISPEGKMKRIYNQNSIRAQELDIDLQRMRF